jgi:hypothetical protein
VQRNKILAGFRIVRVAGDHSPALAGADIATETDCVAGLRGLELAEVVLTIELKYLSNSDVSARRYESILQLLNGAQTKSSSESPQRPPAKLKGKIEMATVARDRCIARPRGDDCALRDGESVPC